MDLVISYKIEKPIYEQIYEQIASQIIKGFLEPNACLPSIRAVAGDLGISVITIKKAWEMLENNNFIYTRAGKGCFVAEHSEMHLEGKSLELARQKLEKDIPYYKSLNLSKEDTIALIEKLWTTD